MVIYKYVRYFTRAYIALNSLSNYLDGRSLRWIRLQRNHMANESAAGNKSQVRYLCVTQCVLCIRTE